MLSKSKSRIAGVNGRWLMDDGEKTEKISKKKGAGKNNSEFREWNSPWFSVLLLFILSVYTNAQTIDSLIAEALTNNPQLKSLEYKITASERRSESVNTLPAPNFSVEFAQVPTNSLDIFNQANSNNFAVSQMFPLGRKLNSMSEVEKKNTLIEGDNYNFYKVNLISQLKMEYYTLWLIDRKTEVQKQIIALLNDLLKSMGSTFTTNRINQADLLTVQSEVATDETQLIILENQKVAEVYKLNKMLGRNLDSKNVFAVKNLPADSLLYSQSKLEELLADSNPALKKMTNMIEMNKAMIESNDKELIPDLMIQGMFMRMPRGMILTSKSDLSMLEHKTETMYSLMFSINLPFAPWSINKYKAKEEELSSGINSIEYERKDMQREMLSKLNEAFIKYQTSLDLIKLYSEKVIPIYNKAAESQLSAYLTNRTGISSLLDTYRMLLMQQMNYYMSQADSRMELAEIEMMVGRRIDEF
jgi:outer membrane protein, heavy metal efflux system